MKLAFGLVLLGCLQFFVAADFQVSALYEMKMKLHDSAGALHDWSDNQVSACYWNNVQCDNENKVVRITLRLSGLSGVLSSSIVALTTLQELSLEGNSITGGIPQEYGNLSSLTTLNLGQNDLSGPIPDSLGRLSKLQNLDLSQNLLNGSIPSSFSNLSNLGVINLAYNNLTGMIPEQLLQAAQYNYTGNHLNCGKNSTACEGSTIKTGGLNNSKLVAILGSVGGLVVLLVAGVIFLLWWKIMRYRPEIYVDVSGEDDLKLEFGQIKRFAWRELQIATNNFSEENVLGKGGFGKVYKGVLPGPDSRKVAVKRLIDVKQPGGEDAFLSEVNLISIAVHKNILRLIGFCTTSTERLLVYPFMENLSVASRLRDIKPNEITLDWPTRRRIALGAARGLEYLHEHCNRKIIHRDVKAANVLLDENLEAVVGDFGLAKLVDMGRTSVTTAVRGTMGHIAPEYLKTGRSSEKTDIFGYGVMLLEIVTGERAIFPDRMEGAGEVLLIDEVKMRLEEGRLEGIVDRNLNGVYDVGDLEKIIKIAILCTDREPEYRPAMSEVVRMLEGEVVPVDRWEEWQQAEVARRQSYETRQHSLFQWSEESLHIPEAIELSDGR